MYITKTKQKNVILCFIKKSIIYNNDMYIITSLLKIQFWNNDSRRKS